MRWAWMVAVLLAACSPTATHAPPAPTTSQMLAQAARSFHDASFAIVESVPVADGTHTAHGRGLLTLSPLAISYDEDTDPPVAGAHWEFISIGTTDYSRLTINDASGPWRKAISTWTQANPSLWPSLPDPILLDSPALNHTPTWHVRSQSGQTTTDLFIRQSDSRPLRLTSTDAGTSSSIFTYDFTAFNTGAKVYAPA
jgi:hypothetical protein